MMSSPRYAIGIDLGTTNCVLAYVDLEQAKGSYPETRVLNLFQRISETEVGEQSYLPSFLYYPTESQRSELVDFSAPEPWVVGEAATQMGRSTSGRLITSTKSWLCHHDIEENSKVLPWGAVEDIPKLSPVQATRKILEHLKNCWQKSPQGQDNALEKQQLTITLPASFDQKARMLTLQAIDEAGMGEARLLEEPQAAFYHWISRKKGQWGDDIEQNRTIFVCDIGGGTSDFSLIQCDIQNGEATFERLAVGRHLLLGGDNIDLELARIAEKSLSSWGRSLPHSQWLLLVQMAREAKEQLLRGELEEVVIRLPGSGRRIIGGMKKAVLTRKDITEVILNQFYPEVKNTDFKITPPAPSADLPYEQEKGVTRHIYEFLKNHSEETPFPDAVLFNGGSLEPSIIRDRITSVLNDLHPQSQQVKVLNSSSLGEAVARGAAYYSFSSIRGGVKIGGGSAHAYYLELSGKETQQALCIMPKGSTPHDPQELKIDGLQVHTNQPVAFPLYESDQHQKDEAGSIRTDLSAAPVGTLNTQVSFGKGESRPIPVHLKAELTELDTVEIDLISVHTEHKWRLEFDLRKSHQPEDSTPVDSTSEETDLAPFGDFKKVISLWSEETQASSLIKKIEKDFQESKNSWSIENLRQIADEILSTLRFDKNADFEGHALNALSFCLRPGFGHSQDRDRLKKVWSLFRAGPHHSKDRRAKSEWAVLWRRVAMGVETGRQNDIYQRNKKSLLDKKGHMALGGDFSELWRMTASMEHLPPNEKSRLGHIVLQHLKSSSSQSDLCLWVLGRFGARCPLQAPLDRIMAKDDVQNWVETLLGPDLPFSTNLSQSLLELARKSGHRDLDIEDSLFGRVFEFLIQDSSRSSEDWKRALENPSERNLIEKNALIGERLPPGLVFSPTLSK